jgi:magnesium transporter
MSRQLITIHGSYIEPSKSGLTHHLKQAEAEGFWLDIIDPDEEDFEVLSKVFGFHQLTIEDIEHKQQRPKLEEYAGYSFMVVFSAEWLKDKITFIEHFIYLGRHYVVTVHDRKTASLETLRDHIKADPGKTQEQAAYLTYMVIDALVDDTFPLLERLDEMIDQLQDDIIEKADPSMLATIYSLKHDVAELRRFLANQRDLFQRLITHSLDLHAADMTVYWRDVQDHILRQYETVDSLRDLLTGAMDVYLSTVSNRLNVTMKTLTIIASLFLPLSFLTGFYGMNFGFLTGVMEPPYWAFTIGILTMLGSLVVQVILFRRRGWL